MMIERSSFLVGRDVMKRQENTDRFFRGTEQWVSEEAEYRVAGRSFEDLSCQIAGFLFRLLEDQAMAEKLTEQILLSRLPSAQSADMRTVSLQLHKIAVALAAKYLDKSERTEQLEDRMIDASRERSDAVGSSIRRLPLQQRVALILYKYQSLTVPEVGAVLGVTKSDARKLLYNALHSLQSEMIGVVE